MNSTTPKLNNRNELHHYERGQRIIARKLGKPAPGTRPVDIESEIENRISEKLGAELGKISGSGSESDLHEYNAKFKKLLENPFLAKTYFVAQRKTFHGKLWKSAR